MKKILQSSAMFLLLMTALGGCATPLANTANADCTSLRAIYVINHGWHTGIALDADDVNAAIPLLAKRFGNPVYYEIGWGDAGFYQADEITPGLALQAMFASQGSVMHVVAIDRAPALRFPSSDVRRIDISPRDHDTLLRHIKKSFDIDANGDITARGKGLYGDSEFYTATGKFHAFNTCNTWTAQALKSAGIDINPAFKLTAGSVLRALDALPLPACASAE